MKKVVGISLLVAVLTTLVFLSLSNDEADVAELEVKPSGKELVAKMQKTIEEFDKRLPETKKTISVEEAMKKLRQMKEERVAKAVHNKKKPAQKLIHDPEMGEVIQLTYEDGSIGYDLNLPSIDPATGTVTPKPFSAGSDDSEDDTYETTEEI
ncbi:MAG: hypothetical protein HRU19_01205 [Pseudobacteriovorax sp.]|nr:hypothetical protein [Pseudobacteriovorax sp.]